MPAEIFLSKTLLWQNYMADIPYTSMKFKRTIEGMTNVNFRQKSYDLKSQYLCCTRKSSLIRVMASRRSDDDLVHWHHRGLLPETWNCGLCMRREYRERFPCYRLRRKPLFSDTGMHHGTCVTHVPWSMSGLLTGCGENVPGIPGACTTHKRSIT